MSSYRDEYYSHVDSLFDTLKPSPFKTPVSDPTPYETTTPGSIQPVGWVRNADGTDGTAKVIIDADGITIYDGKIFLYDYGGNSVLGAAGFAGSWTDFLATKVYNAYFGYGTAGALANTLVNTASTMADYEASLSSLLPYWILTNVAGTVTLTADASASKGYCVRWSGTSFDGTLIQDVPVTPGNYYSLLISQYNTASAVNTFNRTLSYSWRDKDHAIIGSQVNTALAFDFNQSTYTNESDAGMGAAAPATATYLRIQIRYTRTAGSPVVQLSGVKVYESTHIGSMRFLGNLAGVDVIDAGVIGDTYDRFSITSTGTMSWGSGSAVQDVTILRSGAGVLSIMGWKTRGAGTSFPSSPSTGDMFYRTDLGEWCRWDGTYWLGEVRTAYSNITGATATTSAALRPILRPGMSIRYQRWWTSSLVLTTNNASNYWTLYHTTMDNSGSIGLYHNSRSTAADGTSGYVKFEAASTNAVSASSYQGALFYAVKSGAPGALYASSAIEYCPIYT